MHDWDEPVTSQQGRKFLVRNTLIGQALQERWRHQDQANQRVCQALVNGAHHWRTENEVLLAEPNIDTCRLQDVVQFLRSALTVAPCVAQEGVSKLRLNLCLPFDGFPNRRELLYLGWRIRNGRTGP